jgi:hypothetical protein
MAEDTNKEYPRPGMETPHSSETERFTVRVTFLDDMKGSWAQRDHECTDVLTDRAGALMLCDGPTFVASYSVGRWTYCQRIPNSVQRKADRALAKAARPIDPNNPDGVALGSAPHPEPLAKKAERLGFTVKDADFDTDMVTLAFGGEEFRLTAPAMAVALRMVETRAACSAANPNSITPLEQAWIDVKAATDSEGLAVVLVNHYPKDGRNPDIFKPHTIHDVRASLDSFFGRVLIYKNCMIQLPAVTLNNRLVIVAAIRNLELLLRLYRTMIENPE